MYFLKNSAIAHLIDNSIVWTYLYMHWEAPKFVDFLCFSSLEPNLWDLQGIPVNLQRYLVWFYDWFNDFKTFGSLIYS